jgi:glucose/arabinose dehydrogenase
VLPEIWALGFRNPWRFSFDSGNRLVVADVGQNRIEEVDIVEAGKNYGWDVMEGSRCFEPPADCNPEKYALPVYEYTHSDGHSITGGYVYTGNRIPGLKGMYVFGDLNGKIWAFELPGSANGKVTAVSTLAETGFMPTTFGRDSDGELYVADYSNGIIYQLVPAAPAADNPPSN